MFYPQEDYIWGGIVNRTATGLFKTLVDDRVDLVLGSIINGYDRSKIIFPSTPIKYRLSLTLASPRSAPYRWVMGSSLRRGKFDPGINHKWVLIL